MVTIRWLREQIRQGKTIYDLPLRVTFYARVSTEKVEQQGSLENQIQYYTEFIQKNPNWTYVPGYIDEGISGTSTYKRDSFLRMIEDAKRGMFDFIITKEISRFSRNTLDSIQYTQELLDNNVGVLFQNDNINTLDSDSEFRLIVMAGVAQDEVRKLSERDELAALLNISDNQLSYITNVGAGHGLIRCSGNLVPFENSFPRNTKLYRLMTTKPGEA